jgi:hypothetical protein
MSFSREEKQKAKSVTYNIGGNYIGGSVSQSQIATSDSQQSINQGVDLEMLKEILSALLVTAGNLSLERNKHDELQAEIQTLQAQANSPKPKASVIKDTLSSISALLTNVTAATAVYEKIQLLLRSMGSF